MFIGKCKRLKKNNQLKFKVMLKKKLTIEEQREILSSLFSFVIVNEDDENAPHYVIYNEEGDEFYGNNKNLQFNFTSLEGIFAYTAHRAKEQGYADAQCNMRKALGL